MNRRVFVTADNHWGHANIVTFMRKDGTGKIRPYDTLEDMHRDFIARWNATVNAQDLVWCLGDWALGKRTETVAFAEQLNGEKMLIMGNHDTAPAELYLRYFKDLKACHILEKKGIILSHIPVHERQFDRWKLNIHGHLHHDRVMHEQFYESYKISNAHGIDIPYMFKESKWEPDKRYVCVSVEHTDFQPKLLDTVIHEAGL